MDKFDKFILYNVDTHEKIAEAYDDFMCQDMLYMFWEHGVDNIQVQHIRVKKEGEK